MDTKDEKIIKDFINKSFSIRKEFLDFEVNSQLALLLSQLDLFKVIAGLLIGVIGIGYFYNSKLDPTFLIVALTMAILTLVLCVSYTRETIDFQDKQNKATRKILFGKTEEDINVASQSLKEDNSKIFFDHSNARLNEPQIEPQLSYVGETVTFLFYLSMGFLILSFFSLKYQFGLFSFETIVLVVGVSILSFKDWAIPFSEKISSLFNKIFRSSNTIK